MNNSRVLSSMVALGLLGSCGDAPQKLPATQAQAADACSERAHTLFPGISNGEYELIVEPRVRTATGGHFIFEQDGMGNLDPSKPLLVCEGNLQSRVIESIALNGDLRRAPAGQRWSF